MLYRTFAYISRSTSGKNRNVAFTAVLALAGCASINVAGVFDALRKADTAWRFAVDRKAEPVFEPFFVGPDHEPVRCQDGLIISAHTPASRAGTPDIVIIPGLEDDVLNGIRRNSVFVPWIRKWAKDGACVATSCTGAFLAAEAGILNGRTVTTHWVAADLFRQRYPEISLAHEEMIIDSGDVITSGGATTFLNLVIYLTERFGSRERAQTAARLMLIDGDRTSQLPYAGLSSPRTHDDPDVHHVQTLIESNLTGELSVDDLASRVGMSSRTLARRFQQTLGESPGAYLRKARMSEARRLLESTGIPVAEIMSRVGYTDVAAFGRAFKREAGLSPSVYRQKRLSRKRDGCSFAVVDL